MFTVIKKLVDKIYEGLQERQAIIELSSLSDVALKDIGVSRSEIPNIVRKNKRGN